MTDKELAEKVAENGGDRIPIEDLALAEKIAAKFGYVNAGLYFSCVCLNVEFPHSPHELTGEEIFSWPTFGLMVEDAEKRGCSLQIGTSGLICFIKAGAKGKNVFHGDIDSMKQDDHIYNCALAYLEIPNDQ